MEMCNGVGIGIGVAANWQQSSKGKDAFSFLLPYVLQLQMPGPEAGLLPVKHGTYH